MLGMLGDKKKAINDIVLMIGQKMDKKKVGRDGAGNMTEEVSNQEPDQNNDEQMKIIAEDMISAIKDGNADKLASVLSAFSSCCGGEMDQGNDMNSSDNNEE